MAGIKPLAGWCVGERMTAKSMDPLGSMISSLRPGCEIRAYRWVELEMHGSLIGTLQSLLRGRYEKWRRWWLRIAIFLVVVVYYVAREYVTFVFLLSVAFRFGLAIRTLVSKSVGLNSLVLFYDDKATILEDVTYFKTLGSAAFEMRRDVTAGNIEKKFTIAALNPWWGYCNFSIEVRGVWLILSRHTGIFNRARRFQKKLGMNNEITFSDMKRRLLAYK